MRKIYLLLVAALALSLPAAALAQSGIATVTLAEENNSGVSGTATLTDNDDGTTTVRVRLRGGPKGGVHPEHLHEGTCKGTIPTVRYPLNDIVDDESETRIDATLDDLSQVPLFINVHKSADELDVVIACGGVSIPQTLPSTGSGGMLYSTKGVVAPGLALLGVLLAIGTLVLVSARSRTTRP